MKRRPFDVSPVPLTICNISSSPWFGILARFSENEALASTKQPTAATLLSNAHQQPVALRLNLQRVFLNGAGLKYLKLR